MAEQKTRTTGVLTARIPAELLERVDRVVGAESERYLFLGRTHLVQFALREWLDERDRLARPRVSCSFRMKASLAEWLGEEVKRGHWTSRTHLVEVALEELRLKLETQPKAPAENGKNGR